MVAEASTPMWVLRCFRAPLPGPQVRLKSASAPDRNKRRCGCQGWQPLAVRFLRAVPPRLFHRMSATKPATPAFGFLTIVEQPELGLLGGYLVLNAAGRPLEFHCTAPVKANRAQEILYGPTLRPYLCGEQIGQALLSRAKTDVLLVFTDDLAVVGAREFTTSPVVLMQHKDGGSEHAPVLRVALGEYQAALENRYSSDQPAVLSRWKEHGQSLDLLEPFGRIREALEEAQRSARPAA
jgi:hypothetical protein